MKRQNIYFDMDGVLANFSAEPNAVERFAVEKGFFRKLKPLKKNVKALRKLLADGKHDIYILSASPNKDADEDKRQWLKKYRINIAAENVIICRNGQRKKDYMKTADGILFDDYGKNIREWVDERNGAFKVTADGTVRVGLEILELV